MPESSLRDLADRLRALAKLAYDAPAPEPPTKTAKEKLDSVHVLNFIKFFGPFA